MMDESKISIYEIFINLFWNFSMRIETQIRFFFFEYTVELIAASTVANEANNAI